MNFSDAITAHMDWVTRFLTAIEQDDSERLDVDTIALDNACALGKWLYSEIECYSGHAAYIDLKSSHANFHLQAGRIARLINENHPDAARIMLSSTGEFFQASRAVLISIEQFRKEFSGSEPHGPDGRGLSGI